MKIFKKLDGWSQTAFYSMVVVASGIGVLIYGASSHSAEASSRDETSVNSTGALFAVPATTFNADAVTLGAIPDATACGPTPGTPKNITFTTTGLSGAPSSVAVSMTIGSPNHTWMGDIIATLIAPNGASHTVFGRTGSTTATGIGDSSDLGGTYVFSDAAATPPSGGWWQESNIQVAAGIMTSGSYRTTGLGGAGQINPAPSTSLNPAFAGVTNPNGTWTLRVTDGCTGDTGSVSAANLTIVTASVPLDANADFNGDGKTDFTVARATTTPFAEPIFDGKADGSSIVPGLQEVKGSRQRLVTDPNLVPQSPPIYWYTLINGTGTTNVAQLGDAATDFIVTEDFDGDLKDDLVVWTEAPANSANFKILQSSTFTVAVSTFGQTGDDPAIVGDYDGDNKADVAVYRCPAVATPAGQCYFFYRGSLSNPSGNITYVPWGFGNKGNYFPYVGDFDGDGKNDFCIQRTNPSQAGQGQFVLLKSAGGVEYINWGNDSDFLIPGDYDGDGKTDLMVRRTVSGQRQNWLLTRTGATSLTNWGITGDISVPGDYDGDGKTDLAIWRPSTNSANNFFWILNSSNGTVNNGVEWGQCPTGNCDFAVASWAVH